MLADNSKAQDQPYSTMPSSARKRLLGTATGTGTTQSAPQAPQPQVAAAPQQTFAQMQAAGIPRPAPPPLPAPQPLPQSGYPGTPRIDPASLFATNPQNPYGGGATGGPYVPQGGAGMPAPTPTPVQPVAPAPTPSAGSPQAPVAGGMGGTLQQQLMQLLANPSSYDSDAMRREYERGGRQIDDDFALRETQLREEMARRGLADSSIQGGRLNDLNIGRRSAQTELQDSLLQKLADTRSADLRSALGLGIGFYGDEADRALRASELGAAREDRNADLSLRREALGYDRERDTADRTLRQDELMRQFGLDQQRFGLAQNQFDYDRTQGDRGYQLDRDRFAWQQQAANDASLQDWWSLLGGLDLFGLQ